MDNFEQLKSDDKVLFLLSLTDFALNGISQSDGFNIAKTSISNCWKWLIAKEISAYDLYIQLENMDEDDVLSYMALEKDAENKKYWSCVANALAYTTYEAYNFENESYLPQTIESVDSDTINDFINNFNNITKKPSLSRDFIEHILEISNMDIENRIINAKQFLIKQLGS